jgi:hypothetical protein
MSISPGTSRGVTHNPAIGDQRNLPSARRRYTPGHQVSQTLNPMTPVEYGRTVSGGVQSKAADKSNLNP